MKRRLKKLIHLFKGALLIATVTFVLFSCEDDPEELAPTQPLVPESLIYDDFEGSKLVIYQSPQFDVTVAYNRVLNGQVLEFEEADSLPAILKDNLGNYWNIFGEAVKGPNQGARLNFPPQVKAYWFSVATFYPEVSLYSEGTEKERLANIEKDGWLIDTDFVVKAAVANAIPAIYNPNFKPIQTKEMFIDGNHKGSDLILAVRIDGEERIYPERVLEYHEIVNDVFGSTNVVVSFCPLTGTGFCWDRGDRNYYVSGFLHNANLILTDWGTNSNWSQIYGRSISGAIKGTEVSQIQIIEMNWDGRALLSSNKTLDTGQELPERSPYHSYKTSQSIGYPISYEDTRVPAKEKVLAVINNNKAKVYRSTDF